MPIFIHSQSHKKEWLLNFSRKEKPYDKAKYNVITLTHQGQKRFIYQYYTHNSKSKWQNRKKEQHTTKKSPNKQIYIDCKKRKTYNIDGGV